MPAYKSAVVGVDESPVGVRAVELAALMAREMDVRLLLAAAYQGSDGQAQRALADAQRRCAEFGVREVNTMVRAGTPDHVLLDAVGEASADLLVLGSHGHAPLGGRLLGSAGTHDGLIQSAPCDLLVVHTTNDRMRKLISPRYRHDPSRYQRTIMAGAHDSPRAMRAVERAAEVALDTGARLVVCGTYRPNDRATVKQAIDYLHGEAYIAQGSASIEDILREADERARRVGATDVERLVIKGDPVRGMMKAVDKFGVDVLVMGKNRLSGGVVTSLGEAVSRRTPTHVLLVR